MSWQSIIVDYKQHILVVFACERLQKEIYPHNVLPYITSDSQF